MSSPSTPNAWAPNLGSSCDRQAIRDLTARNPTLSEGEVEAEMRRLMKRRGFIDSEVVDLFLRMNTETTKDMLAENCLCQSCLTHKATNQANHKRAQRKRSELSDLWKNEAHEKAACEALSICIKCRRSPYLWLSASSNCGGLPDEMWGAHAVTTTFPLCVDAIASEHGLCDFVDKILDNRQCSTSKREGRSLSHRDRFSKAALIVASRVAWDNCWYCSAVNLTEEELNTHFRERCGIRLGQDFARLKSVCRRIADSNITPVNQVPEHVEFEVPDDSGSEKSDSA